MGTALFIDARGRRVTDVARCIERPYNMDYYVEKVRDIVAGIAERGYEAVMEYSKRFDGVAYDDPRVPDDQFEKALEVLNDDTLWALRVASERIRRYQESIMPRSSNGLQWKPVERVAAYAPGGKNPYPSTVLMTVIPARVASVRYVAVATPPIKKDEFMVNPAILAAAKLARANDVFAVGGAQAIAGLAYGAQPLPQVDMIVGPGSPYVEAAKLLVSHRVGIDMVAGPSEIVVLAGANASPLELAYDLLAQAEHGPLSLAVLLSPEEDLAKKVYRLVNEAVNPEHMGNIYVVVVEGLDYAIDLVNHIAPEHVEIMGVDDPSNLAMHLTNTGAIAVNVPVAYTDYVAGPSHVLPTSGAARWRSGLSVYDFLKPVAVVDKIDYEGLRAAYILARLEGFRFHAESLRLRMREED